MSLSKAEILERVKNRSLSPEAALRLYRELERASCDVEARPDEAKSAQDAAPRLRFEAERADPAPACAATPADIAIVGLSGQMPGAQDIARMWDFLSAGGDAVGELPPSRRPLENASADTERWGGFLEHIDRFDPLFFEISPMEAEQMDPQQRLLLQESWKAFEDAGYPAESLAEKACCVFVGCSQGDYLSESAIGDINPHSLTGRSVSAMAARISYFFNLRGPSVTVNTACSSSLTALTMACERLRAGDAELGLVCGVSLMCTRTAYRTMTEVGMIAPGDKCRTFDRDARGIVPGEAVGAVVLKRLADALRDGDRIHGVVRAYGINHDGKTNGLTAPSGPAQTALLLDVYRRFGIDPNTLGYIEAHGTGTKLGDPIEVHALADAFAHYRVGEGQCAIGSIKTNIGHTLEAAGLMGLFKVLLCLQRRKLVPSLHFERPNEHIAFAGSPFYVNARLRDWPRVGDRPLRAGISAFGMNGTNAHIVIEEAPPRAAAPARTPDYCLIPLSAKTPEALARRIEDLLEWLDARAGETSFSLAELAYTLQAGRSHFEYRTAAVARDAAELRANLARLPERRPETIAAPERASPESLRAPLEEAMRDLAAATRPEDAARACAALADRYVRGATPDWRRLYPQGLPARIALPAYPFARQSYWLRPADDGARTPRLHPLLHENVSTLDETRYISRFGGGEFFLSDHRVRAEGNLRPVMPGAVYLEMGRAAVLAASGHAPDTRANLRLTDIAWIRPLFADPPPAVQIRVTRQADAALRYEIYAETPAGSVLHAEGGAQFLPDGAARPAPAADLDAIRGQLRRTLDAETCYRRIRAAGVEHGERLQALRGVAASAVQALAELSLPAATRDRQGEYGLHPALIDAAIQAAIALDAGGADGNAPPSLPFALESLEIFGECAADMLAWLRYAPDGTPQDPVQKLDIDLCDRQGEVRVRMKGLSSRSGGGRLPAETRSDGTRPDPAALPVHVLTPIWDAVPAAEFAALKPDPQRRLTVAGASAERLRAIRAIYPQTVDLAISAADSIEEIARTLQSRPCEHLVWIAPETRPESGAWLADDAMVAAQREGVAFLFRLIKALLAAGYDERSLELTLATVSTQEILPRDATDPTHAGVHGLAGSLAKEYPHWQVRLLDLDAAAEWPLDTLFAVPADPEGKALAYRARRPENAGPQAEWLRQTLIRVHPLQATGPTLYREGGVYVVVGGAGGIGEVWSRHMIERYGAKIVWIGRREPDEAIRRRIEALPDPDGVTYIAADARDPAALERAYKRIKALHPKIHGVAHSAIVLNDLSLARMDEGRFMESLSAKVDICVRLIQTFRKEPLDFALFFSSMQSFARAPGQSNYAAGCAFEDAFALKLARRWPHTFSNGGSHHKPQIKIVNWGYWGSIGIVNDAAYRDRRRNAGDGSIEPHEGMDILDRFMASPFRQIAPFKALTAQVVSAACGMEDIAAYPPRLPAILERVERRFDEGRADLPHAQTEWRQLEAESQNPEMDALLLRLLDAHLRSLSLRDGQTALPGYLQRWLEESLRLLNVSGARRPGESLAALWETWTRAKSGWMKNANLQAAVVLVETCVRALPDILAGRRAATEVMFPNASMELVEGVYRGNVVSDFFQHALADFLVAAIEERLRAGGPGTTLRILEIGAGTGGTTAIILPRLQPYAEAIEEYCYTDLSKAFLLHAKKHYAPGRPFLKTRIFNVEKPLAEQTGADIGVGADRYDFAIAANVLHATKNMRRTLRNAKAALKANGILLLNELSRHSLLSHLTFGLLEGWWLYEDTALRIPGSPGLYPETWQEILAEEGFAPVCLPVDRARSLGLQIVAAQSDGFARQTRPALDPSAMQEMQTRPPQDARGTREAGPPAAAQASPPAPPAPDASVLRAKAVEYLKERVAQTLKMNPRQIDPAKPFEIYGIDSILVVQLANALRKDFPKIGNTLFFEHQTVEALADHFAATQKEALARALGPSGGAPAEARRETPPPQSAPTLPAVSVAAPTAVPSDSRAGFHVFDVAVIGLSGRYPKAPNIDALWERLLAGDTCIDEIPADRWDWRDYFDARKGQPGKLYTRWGGFLEKVDRFDPGFFRIAPRDAEAMDPQERLFLQCAYEALQDAGYTPENFGEDRLTGVFVGAMNSSYRGKPAHFSIANRVSYHFDFQGPSMAIDTACSASLTALHVALESLYCGDCRRAVVGGANLILDPEHFIGLTELGMLSAGPECKAFGADADGFVASEGVGAAILKPLAQAIADGDSIYGVIKGSAVNAGGKTHGYTVPNPKAQAAMAVAALRRAGVSPAAIGYIEAHGTGTALGDPIEIDALTKAFETASDPSERRAGPCAIGSIKSNLGHCESAAGIAGLTKLLLQLRHKRLVPSLHCAALNPDIEFADTPFAVQREPADWPRPSLRVGDTLRELPRTAGLSSFGAGGANAHVIVQEYLPDAPSPQPSALLPAIVPLSAKNGERLRAVAERLLKKLRERPRDEDFCLANLAYTLQVGREAMEARAGFLADSLEELARKLEAFLASDDSETEGAYRSPAVPDREALAALRADEDVAAMIDAWVAKRKYAKLLEFWARGLNVDWRRLYDARDPARPRRIRLPLYPFLEERYWFESSAPQARRANPPSARTPEVPAGVAYLARWEAQAEIPEPAQGAPANVLIVHGESAARFEATIAARHAGARVLKIRLAEATRQLSADEWTCGLGDPSGFAECLKRAGEIDRLYFLALDDAPPSADPLTDWPREAENRALQLLRLAKTLAAERRSPQPLDAYVLTLDAHPLADENVRPQGASLTGLAYALAQGDGRFAVRNIDLSAEDLALPERRASVLSAILREPAAERGDTIKIRAGVRYRQAFRELNRPEGERSPIRQRGVYVLLGGAGSIGRAVSRHLLRHYQARVVWLGRSPEDSAKVRTALSGFSDFPEPPRYFQADATCPDSLRQAFERIENEYPVIHGAIYSALEFDAENSVAHTSETRFREILEVKTRGSANFYRALQDRTLDFLCYFSSGQAYAFSGAAKHSAYAAGIVFADSLVHALRKRAAFPVGAINWGFWRSSLPPGHAARSFACLEDAEGCDCFERFVYALQSPQPLPQALCFRPSPAVWALMNPGAQAPAVAAPPARAQAAADPVAFVRELVADSLADAVKTARESVDPNLPFAEYGLDSILGVRFVNRIGERLNVRLNTAIVFEHSSVSRLSAHLLKTYRAAVEAALGAAADAPAAIAEARPEKRGETPATIRAGETDIAVIGMSGQFPGAATVAEFWDNLLRGVDGLTEYPERYLNLATHYSPEKTPGKSYCKRGGILRDRDRFDPRFFNISPREAHSMNPHQRLILQEGWKALEDAGYDPTRLSGSRTGVFVGAEPTGYFHESFAGASDALIAARLSYFLNLQGPTMLVNTACSSSGTAIHLACESLRNGESDLALAGGVNACMNQAALVNLSAADMLSPSGRCATFDAAADGTVISEGIGVLVLKRLRDAIADGDAIDGVICASGVNQDGASNGIVAPNGQAQERLIVDVYRKYGIDPADIGYVEAHGTGTKLGDPVEANALARAFETLSGKPSQCLLGSAKAHIGHASAAACVIGAIKTLLSLRHGQIPPLPHFRSLNPLIEFDGSPFRINTAVETWPARDGAPRMAAINSFGHSGANVHLVVREYPAPAARATAEGTRTWAFPLSAKTESALRELAKSYAEFLAAGDAGVASEAIAYTLQTGREAMRHRVAFVASSRAEWARSLADYLDGRKAAGLWQGTADPRDTREPYRPEPGESAERLAERWCGGQAIDWASAWSGKPVLRAHLPTYPFERKEYGIAHAPTAAHAQTAGEARHSPPPQTAVRRADELRAQLQARREELENPAMEASMHDLLWGTLHAAGLLVWADGRGESGEIAIVPLETAAARASGKKTPEFYRLWLAESVEALIARNYLQRRSGRLFAQRRDIPGLEASWRAWESEKARWLSAAPEQRAHIELAEACLQGLPAILSGQKPATDILFPGGGLELVEGIYRSNPISDYFNEVLTEALLNAIRARLDRTPQARLRILEIGAGTGGATRGLLPRLREFGDAIAEYCYTDLSKVFLNHAKRHYAPGHPFLTTRLLDIDKPLAEQDMPTGQFDFAVAVNVLHATGDIRRTLRHARSALRPGGLLLLNEMSDKSLFVHLTFGLLEGWWLYRDGELRIPGIPGLAPESWARVLAETGFVSVDFPAQAEHGYGQQIVVAQNGLAGGAEPTDRPGPARGEASEDKTAGRREARPSFAATDAATAAGRLRDFVGATLAELLADALSMETQEIAEDESFADYGLDSLLGIQFVRALNGRLGLDLETVAIFDYNTLRTLREHIVESYPQALAACAPPCPSDAPAPAESAPVERAAPRDAVPAEGAAFVQEPVAIVGMSGRFARSPDLDALWKNLAEGQDQVRKASRWNLSDFFPQETLDDPNFCDCAGFLDDIDRFDAAFFKISGTEATYMDPQQRLFLETAWSALEDAGYATEQADGRQYGVFLGYGGTDYARLFDPRTAPAQAFWGNSASIIPARIAYYLNVKGPAVTVDTACSGSLVAMHQACQHLWTREIDLALAGAVSVMCTPTFFQTGSQAGMLSPGGRCRTFDARADGFVPGEGVGVVALKRLSDALADGDPIHGVIRGIGVNQDGSTNGITAPSAKSQESLERQIYERFRIDPAGIQMVEAHGTGTKLGDPIEVSALTRAFRAGTDKVGYCALGSIKTNVGHIGPAAGIAGLFKILLAMKHGQLPPSLHFERANPEIRFDGGPFYVNTQLRDWRTAPGEPRRAVLSSFGFSGTNAHLAIEEAPRRASRHAERPAWPIALSARSPEQLARQAENLAAWLADAQARGAAPDLGDLAYTLLLKRKHWGHRLACVVGSAEELSDKLRAWLRDGQTGRLHLGAAREERGRARAEAQTHATECLERCRHAATPAEWRANLETVAERYAEGHALDFSVLFGAGHLTLSLPTYPFARERYWVESAPMPAASAREAALSAEPVPAAVQPQTEEPEWLFVEEAWTDTPLPADIDWTARLRLYAGQTIWAVHTEERDGEALTRLLTQLQTASQMSPPLQVHTLSARAVLDRTMPLPSVVLFLGPSQPVAPAEQTLNGDSEAVYRLSQFLMQRAWDERIRLYYLYEDRADLPRLDCAALSGLLGTAMMENPNHAWTLIGRRGERPAASAAQTLLQEWLADDPARPAADLARREAASDGMIFHSLGFPQVRYEDAARRGKRRAQTDFDHAAAPIFQAGKTYLLAGGLGLIGEELCAELARRYRPTLVILSRSPYDATRQAQCRTLENLGAQVHYYSTDIADRAAMQEIRTAIARQVGPLHGVIQLANATEGGLIAVQAWDAFLRAGTAKIRGSLNLDELTAGEPLDFFVLFSSIGAFGIRGSAGYSHACAFQNEFAAYRRQLRASGRRKGETVSLTWGPWTSDPIHAILDTERSAKIRHDGFALIAPAAAFPLLERSPGQNRDRLGIWAISERATAARYMDVEIPSPAGTSVSPPIAPATAESPADAWAAQIAVWETQAGLGDPSTTPEALAQRLDFEAVKTLPPALIERIHRLLFPPAPAEPTPMPETIAVAAPPPEPREPAVESLEYVKATVREMASALLKVQRMDEDEAFQNYGMDSVFGVQLALRLEKKLGLEIPPKWLIDFPTIGALSAHILERQRAQAETAEG